MRVSAIRVGPDLWRLLEDEASRVGVSVSQYVREAALARASAAATARGEGIFHALAQTATQDAPAKDQGSTQSTPSERARRIRSKAHEAQSDAHALQAQSQQARRRSLQLQADQPDADKRPSRNRSPAPT